MIPDWYQPCEITPDITSEDGIFNVSLRIKPDWDGMLNGQLRLTQPQRDVLTDICAAEAITRYASGVGETFNRQGSFVMDAFDSSPVQCRISPDGEIQLSCSFPFTEIYYETTRYAHMDFLRASVESPINRIIASLIKEAIVFNDAADFFVDTNPLIDAQGAKKAGAHIDSAYTDAIASTEEITGIGAWLTDHGIYQFRILSTVDDSKYSYIFECGKAVVRVSPKSEPCDIQGGWQMLEAYFSNETEHLRVDIFPRIEGNTARRDLLGDTMEAELLKQALAQGVTRDGKRYVFHDSHGGNIMYLPNKKRTPVIVDWGAVNPWGPGNGSPSAEITVENIWVTQDGTPEQHDCYPVLKLEGQARKDAFKKEVVGSEVDPNHALDEWLLKRQGKIYSHIKPKIDEARSAIALEEAAVTDYAPTAADAVSSVRVLDIEGINTAVPSAASNVLLARGTNVSTPQPRAVPETEAAQHPTR